MISNELICSVLIRTYIVGKSLLDTIAHLEEQLQQANTDYEEKSEELEQYKYTAEMKLEVQWLINCFYAVYYIFP